MSTNVIIDELLSFFITRMDTGTPKDLLVKLCADFYSVEEINRAKGNLVAYVPSEVIASLTKEFPDFVKTRSGQTTKSPLLCEIFSIVQQVDRKKFPSFVARNLLRLPSMSLTHFDFASIMGSYSSLKSEFEELKLLVQNIASSDVSSLKPELDEIKSTLNAIAARQQPAPATTSPESSEAPSVVLPSGAVLTDSINRHAPVLDNRARSGSGTLFSRPATGTTSPTEAGTYASAAAKPTSTRKPRPTQATGGRGSVSHGLQGPKSTVGANIRSVFPNMKSVLQTKVSKLFVSRFAPETTESTVANYVSKKLKCPATCSKIVTASSNSASFKLVVPAALRAKVVSPDFWPAGILVRTYYEPKPKVPPSESVPSDGQPAIDG